MSLFFQKITAWLSTVASSALFGYLSLTALQLKVVWGSWAQWDLSLWDGATYYIYGRQVATSLIFPPLEWSPAFAGYYALFHLVFGAWGPLAVYWIQRFVTLVLVVWLLYGWLRSILPALVAWLLTACYIGFQIGLNNAFVVHLFVLIPLLVAYRASLSHSAWGRNLVLIGLLAAAFVRSEFFLSVVLVLVGMIVVAVRRRYGPLNGRVRLRRYAPVLIWTMLLGAMIVRAGPSQLAVDRAWGAFEQHYAWGYQERHPDWNANFWFKYADAVQRSFGTAQSIGQAAINNPLEMVTHFLWNLHVLPTALPDLLSSLPGMNWILIVLGAGVMGLPLVLIKQRNTSRQLRAPDSAEGGVGWLVVVIIATLLPLLGSIIIIRPRAIYLIPLLPPLLLLAGTGLQYWLSKLLVHKQSALLLPLGWLIVMAIFPSPFDTPIERYVFETAQKLQTIPLTANFALLGPSARGFCIYSLPDRCRGVEIAQVPSTVTDFPAYLARENIQVIIVNDQVQQNLPPAGQAFLARLVTQPTEVGWQVFSQTGPFPIYLHSSSLALPLQP